MNDLISREEALSHPFANDKYDKENVNLDYILGFESYKEWLETLPIVDIMECARALKEHCNEHLRNPHNLCDDCPMFERVCRRFNVVPRWWDLPEGEKE